MSSTYDPRTIKHKKGGDDLVPLPDDLTHLAEKGIVALKYGQTVLLRGAGLSTHIMDELRTRINRQESIVIIVTGGPGTGKTYLGLRFAQMLDPSFHITDLPEISANEDHGQLAFSREHLAYLVSSDSPLKRGQVIMLDESHFAISSRDWNNRDQKDLVNLISAVRSRGFILILIVLHSTMIDKIIRDYVANYEASMQTRGSAVLYRRWFPQFSQNPYSKRLGRIKLRLPDESLCNYASCLGCGGLLLSEDKRCETLRAIYERRKADFLDRTSAKITNEAEEREPALTREERNQLVLDNKRFLFRNSRGLIELSSVQSILGLHDQPSGDHVARSIKRWIEANHPDMVKELPRSPEFS